MNEQVILATSYGVALADATVPCVITQWYAFANKTDFISLQGAALAYYEQHATPEAPWGWVGDVRRMGAIPAEVQQWLQDEFNPRAQAAGLRLVAVVLAETIFGKIATQRYTQQTQASPDSDIAVQYYQSLEEAKEAVRQALAS